jgi:outer membrane immunogenic protein
MKKLIATAALLASFGAIGAANAEPFNGGYIGAQAGISRPSLEITVGVPGVRDVDASKTGFSGGIYAGFDFKASDNFVVGIEGDINFGGSSASDSPVAGINVVVDPKYDYSITARAGFLATPKLLIYARGGFASDRISLSVRVPSNTSLDVDAGTGFSEGFLVGGGIEFAVTDNVSLRAEYRYRDLKGSFRSSQALAGVAFRF